MDSLNDAPQNEPVNQTQMDAVRERYNAKPKSALSMQNKAVASLLAVLVLAIGLAVGVTIVQRQESTEDRAGASSTPDVAINLNASKTTLAAGETATVDVSLSPAANGEKKITAADFRFQLVNADGQPSNSMVIKDITISENNTTLKTELLKDVTGSSNTGRLALGAECTEADGAATCKTYDQGTAFIAAKVTVQAKAGAAAESVKLTVNQSEVAALDAANNDAAIDNNIATNVANTQVAFAVTGTGGGGDACLADIVGANNGPKDGYVDLNDFGYVKLHFDAANECQGEASCLADIVGANNGPKDGYVDLNDFGYVKLHFDAANECNQ